MSNQAKHLRHVVLFQFKENATADNIQMIESAFRALAQQLDLVRAYEWGINNSPEGINQDFTHCFFLTFASEEDRNAYLPHPSHQQFVQILRPHLEKALVIDYWANE